MNKLYNVVKRISEGIESIDKKAVKISLTVAVLFAVVWLIYGIHLNDFTHEYKSVMFDFIMSQTEKESQCISSEFEKKCEIITHGSRSIGISLASGNNDEIANILATISSTGKFESTVYIDKNNTIYFQDGSIARDYDVAPIVAKYESGSSYTAFNNMEGFIDSKGGLGVISRVVQNNETVGYICGVSDYDSLVNHEDLRRELPHEEVILDNTGTVTARIYSNDSVKAAENEISFFDSLHDVMTETDYDAFTREFNECVSANVSGLNRVSTSDGILTLIYYPILGSDGWTVMNCYPNYVIMTKTRSIQIKAILMFTLIVIIMIITAILLIKYLSSERKRVTELEFLDGLTGVYNRNAFVSHAEKTLKENKNLPYYMICFDVINFRIINETYGHERSDIIIKAMAEACKEAFGHNETYGRLTADVFVALTIDDGEEDERIEFIENKVAEEAKKVFINHPIKIKRGRYEVVDIAESINRMIDKANIARKFVNSNSTQASCQYSEELMNDARKAEDIESKMELALQNGEFKPYLQGKFNMVENRVVGAEALVRWIKDDGTVIPPGDFIPLFEQNGFVEKIDFYMLEEICKYLRRMIDEGREVYKISVNQSRYLMNDPEYVSKVKDILLRYQIPIGLIEMELTETVFFHEKERMIKMMNDLKTMNVELAIDDFGSGYSSFNILKDVPFDVLKIDREFLTDSVHTEKGKWILQEIVEMAHGLGMSVICEGVETQEQIDLLVSIHCHLAQGFFYSRPIPMDEFIEKYNI